jgi:hypothetical protein
VRLNRGEYWLLAQAATLMLPLYIVALPDDPSPGMTLQDALNCQGHGMSHDELARTLLRMARRGWIRFFMHSFADLREAPFPSGLRPIADEFARTSPKPHCGFYALTAAGGSVWERFAWPRWDRYVDDLTEDYADDGTCTRRITIGNRRLLNDYLEAVRREVDVVTGSETIRAVAEWCPAYWKPPMPAFECRLRMREWTTRSNDRWRSTGVYAKGWCEWLR